MRYNSVVKNKVRLLRAKGLSLRQIQQKTSIPVTTIRTWIKDINLSKDQKVALKAYVQDVLQKGRERVQKEKKEQRKTLAQLLYLEGKRDIGKLSPREFFIAGIALYWAEGFKNKHERRLGFCNSDPNMIRFYIEWLENNLKIDRKDIVARVTLNKLYEKSDGAIQKYWSEITGLSLGQFTKTFYQTTKWKKQYITNNYKGVLRIHVKNSLEYLLKMKGWIDGLNLVK